MRSSSRSSAGLSVVRSVTLPLCLLVFSALSDHSLARADAFDWRRVQIEGRPAFTILPPAERRREPMPWVLYAPTFDRRLPSERDEGWMIRQFLAAGIAVAGVDVGESYGSPGGRAAYSALYEHVTASHPRFARKVSLLARSRGGLMVYNWAVENADKIACIAGIYPVCDLRSYPGLARARVAYGLSESRLSRLLPQHNPVDRLASLATARVPIFHIHGDVDTTVPLDANSGAVAKRYAALGGAMELEVPPGQGHNMWPGFFHSGRLVRFVIRHATGVPVPIAHWMLDEKSGGAAHDAAGNHVGTIFGAAPVEGKHGGARLFNRPSGDYIAIPYSKDFELETFTVAAWVQLTRPPTFSGILGTRFGGEQTFDMKVNQSKVHGDIGDGEKWIETEVNFCESDTGSNDQGGKLAVGPWYHVVYVVDSTKQACRLYLNADLKKTIPFDGTARLMKPGQEMRIGNSSTDEFMDGAIDDVQIFDVALTATEVRALERGH